MGDDVQKDEQAVLESIYADDFSMSAARTGAVRLRAPLTEDSDTKSNGASACSLPCLAALLRCDARA